jgi:hypothetical protein
MIYVRKSSIGCGCAASTGVLVLVVDVRHCKESSPDHAGVFYQHEPIESFSHGRHRCLLIRSPQDK